MFLCRKLPATSSFVIAPVLRLLASVYELRESTRQFLYRAGVFSAYSLPAPVISVGNLTSASGKTPLVSHLARHYHQFHGINSLIIQLGEGTVDEAIMLEQEFQGTPIRVVETSNPVELRDILLDDPSLELVFLDNGLQHLPLMRDLDIITLNAFSPLGNGHLRPRGSLRESPRPALRRADAAVIHHVDIAGEEKSTQARRNIEHVGIPRHTLRIESMMMPIMLRLIISSKPTLDMSCDSTELGEFIGLSALEKSAVVCLTGVGSPITVEAHAKKLGAIHVEGCGSNEDHHIFNIDEVDDAVRRIRFLMKDSRFKHVCLLMTEKDFWRQRHFWSSVLMRYSNEIWDGKSTGSMQQKWGAYLLHSELQLLSHDSRFSSESAMWGAMLRLAMDHYRGRSYSM